MRVGPLPAGRGPAAEAGLNYRGRPLVPQPNPWSLLALGESYKPMLRGTKLGPALAAWRRARRGARIAFRCSNAFAAVLGTARA